MGISKDADKKKDGRFIDTYVVKVKPAPENTRPSRKKDISKKGPGGVRGN